MFEDEQEKQREYEEEDMLAELEYEEEYEQNQKEMDDRYERNLRDQLYRNRIRVGKGKSGCKFWLILIVVVALVLVFNNSHKKHQAEYSKAAISEAEIIELNTEYKEKTFKNKLDILDNNNRRWKGFLFSVSESGTVDVEYCCERMRKSDEGPTWVIWRLVEKNTGIILQESEWAELEHEPFTLKKGEYVLEFASISNQFGFDGRKRPFTFKVNFIPAK